MKGWGMLMVSRWQGVINWGSWERSSISQNKRGWPFPSSGKNRAVGRSSIPQNKRGWSFPASGDSYVWFC